MILDICISKSNYGELIRGFIYHKFVNTTPNPRATKKSSGELVGPPPPPLLDWVLLPVGEPAPASMVCDADMVAAVNSRFHALDRTATSKQAKQCSLVGQSVM
jgi:hypothetical protein